MDTSNLKIFKYLEKNHKKLNKPRTLINVLLITINVCKKTLSKKKLRYSHIVYYLPQISEYLYDKKIINDDLFVAVNEIDNEELIDIVDDLMSIRGCFVKYI